MLIKRKSMASGIERELDIPIKPEDLTEDQREFIISGVTQEEWDDMFKEDEQEPYLPKIEEAF
jgi:hypothetical protein